MLNMSISTSEFCDKQEETLSVPLCSLVFCPFPQKTRNYFLLHSALFCCCLIYFCHHLLDSKSLWGIDLNVVSRVSYCTKVLSNKINESHLHNLISGFQSQRMGCFTCVVPEARGEEWRRMQNEAHPAVSIQLRRCGATWRLSQIPYLRPRLLCLLIYAAHHLNWRCPYIPSLDYSSSQH